MPTSLVPPSGHRSLQSSSSACLAVLAVKGPGVRIPSAPPSRSRVSAGQSLDPSSECGVLYGLCGGLSHIRVSGLPRNGSKSDGRDQLFAVDDPLMRALLRSSNVCQTAATWALTGSDARVSTPSGPYENQHQDLTDALATRGWMVELDKFLARQVRVTYPTKSRQRSLSRASVAGLFSRTGAWVRRR